MAAPSSQILKGITLSQHWYGSMPTKSGKAGATIAVNDVLAIVDATGLLGLAAHDATSLVVGVAKSIAVSGGTVNYIPAWSGCIFEITKDTDVNTGLVNGLVADTDRLQQYGLGIDAGNGKPYLNGDEETATILTVVDIVQDAVLGAAYQRVLVQFMQNKTVWGA